jgi:RNA-directed DNA polymerase
VWNRRWNAYGKSQKEKFIALFHHISIEVLKQSFFELQEDAAPGVDRLTWTDYEADLGAQA